MRHLLIFLGAMSIAVPAAAAPQPDYAPSEDYTDLVPPQEEIERAGDSIHRVLGALMDVPVGGLIEAVDPERRVEPHRHDETLGDLARRDDPYFEERMHASVGAVTQNMGEIMAGLLHVAPLLERSIDDIERSVDDAVRGVPPPYAD